MTRPHIGGGDLVVRLPWRWALAARRRSMRLPLEFVDEVRFEPHWRRACARVPVLVVTTLSHGAPYARLAVSTADPEGDAAWLRQDTARQRS